VTSFIVFDTTTREVLYWGSLRACQWYRSRFAPYPHVTLVEAK
jgi:hypothetical protein